MGTTTDPNAPSSAPETAEAVAPAPPSSKAERAGLALDLRKEKSKQKLDAIKARVASDKEEMDEMDALSANIDNFDKLSPEEQAETLSDVGDRVLLLLATLVQKGKLKLNHIATDGFLNDIKNKGSIDIPGGSLSSIDKNITKLFGKVLALPAGATALKSWNAEYWPSILESIKIVNGAATAAVAAITGDESAAGASEDELGVKKWIKKHPYATAAIAMAGAYASYRLIKRLFGGKKKSKSSKSGDEEGFFGKIWKWTKRTALVAGGIFVAGNVLDMKSVKKFLKEKLKLDVDENRVTKALIHFGNLDVVLGVNTLLYGTDKRQALHERCGSIFHCKSETLWLLGNRNVKKFQNYYANGRPDKPFSAGILSKIPGISFLINDSLIDEELRLYNGLQSVGETYEKHGKKLTIGPNEKLDDILPRIHNEIGAWSSDSEVAKAVLSQDDVDELAEMEKGAVHLPMTKAQEAFDSINKTGIISKEQFEFLNDESTKLLDEVTLLKDKVPRMWDEVHQAGIAAGLGSFLVLAPWFGQNKTDYTEDGDLVLAQEEFEKYIETDVGKAMAAEALGVAIGDLKDCDLSILGVAQKEISDFRDLLSKVKPGEKIDPTLLKDLDTRRKKVFGINGEGGLLSMIRTHTLIGPGNNKRYIDMVKDYEAKHTNKDGSINWTEVGNDGLQAGSFMLTLMKFSTYGWMDTEGSSIREHLARAGGTSMVLGMGFGFAKGAIVHRSVGGTVGSTIWYGIKVPAKLALLPIDASRYALGVRKLMNGGLSLKEASSSMFKIVHGGSSLRRFSLNLHNHDGLLGVVDKINNKNPLKLTRFKIFHDELNRITKALGRTTEITETAGDTLDGASPVVRGQLREISRVTPRLNGVDITDDALMKASKVVKEGDGIDEATRKIIVSWNRADKCDYFKNPAKLREAKAVAQKSLDIISKSKPIPLDQFAILTRTKNPAKIAKILNRYFGNNITDIDGAVAVVQRSDNLGDLAPYVKDGTSLKVGSLSFLFKAGVVFGVVGTAMTAWHIYSLVEKAKQAEKTNPTLANDYMGQAKAEGFVAIIPTIATGAGLAAWITGSAALAFFSMTAGTLSIPLIPVGIAVEGIYSSRKFRHMKSDDWLKAYNGKLDHLFHEWVSTTNDKVSAGEAWDATFTFETINGIENTRDFTRGEIVKSLITYKLPSPTFSNEDREIAYNVILQRSAGTLQTTNQIAARESMDVAYDFTLMCKIAKESPEKLPNNPKMNALVSAVTNGSVNSHISSLTSSNLYGLVATFRLQTFGNSDKVIESLSTADIAKSRSMTEFVMFKYAKTLGYKGQMNLKIIKAKFFTTSNKNVNGVYWHNGAWRLNFLYDPDISIGPDGQETLEKMGNMLRTRNHIFKRRDSSFVDRVMISPDQTFKDQSRRLGTLVLDGVTQYSNHSTKQA